MGTSQQFSLRWNNYLRHIRGAFDSLRTDEDLVDVTLSCEGRKIRAHKMLLSACSTYFRDLFKENPCQHPIIIFKDVKFVDLKALIDFIYQGEVNVVQDQLSSFLLTAELLAVQGLTDGSSKDVPEISSDSNTVRPEDVSSSSEEPELHSKPNTSKAQSNSVGPVTEESSDVADKVETAPTHSSLAQKEEVPFLKVDLKSDFTDKVEIVPTHSSHAQTEAIPFVQVDLPTDFTDHAQTKLNEEISILQADLQTDFTDKVKIAPSHAQTKLKEEISILQEDLHGLYRKAVDFITTEEANTIKLKEKELIKKEKRLKELELGQKRQEKFRQKRKMEITKLLAKNPQLKTEVPSLREKRGRPRLKDQPDLSE